MASRYDAGTALIVVDMQNDFVDPAGTLSVRGADQIVDRVNREVAAARDAGALVVYTQDFHPPATPHFAKDGGVWPVHCVGGAWGSEFHPALAAHVGPVIRKGTGGEDGYSGFTVRDPTSGDPSATALGHILDEAGITEVVIAGVATDYCVKDTALDARALGLGVTVLEGAVRAVDLEPGDGTRAFTAMRAAGVTIAD